jgi:hypothetical protein
LKLSIGAAVSGKLSLTIGCSIMLGMTEGHEMMARIGEVQIRRKLLRLIGKIKTR